ncbi:hypothetical protein DSECCO2_201990 [anaerobic digester metagenome]
MTKTLFIQLVLVFNLMLIIGCKGQNLKIISPNEFEGSDTERIQAAVDKASGTTNKIVIPATNSNGSNIWLLDSAILLPSNIVVLLDNCTIQLSDKCRDNMFRSDNVGKGVENPEWNNDISIIGIGDVTLKGAYNPRSTGDSGKTLSLDPAEDYRIKVLDNPDNPDRGFSYGTDAGKEGVRQKGDWRNIMILIGYTDGYQLKNVTIENSHAWAVSHERVINAEVSNIRLKNPKYNIINGKKHTVANRDGINLRQGCKNFRIDNISGQTGDDCIALTTLGLNSETPEGGIMASTMVTTRRWRGPEDDTERIYITNVRHNGSHPAVSIRANDVASINNVYINGIFSDSPWHALLVGGRGWGSHSQPGKINNIHAMNIFGNGGSLIEIHEAIANCSFTNGIYSGKGDQIISYKIDKDSIMNVITQNLIKINK